MNTFITRFALLVTLATAARSNSIRGAGDKVSVQRETQLFQNAVAIAQGVAQNVTQSSAPQETFSEIVTNAQETVGNVSETVLEAVNTTVSNIEDQVQTGIETAQTFANSTMNATANFDPSNLPPIGGNYSLPEGLPQDGLGNVTENVPEEVEDALFIARLCQSECETMCADELGLVARTRCQNQCIIACVQRETTTTP